MESLRGQAQSGWLAPWIVSMVAILAVLAMAAPASGQTPPDAGAQPAEASPVPASEPSPAPEPVPTEPEAVPIEVPDVAVAAEEPAKVATPPAPTPASRQPVSDLVAKTVEDTSETATEKRVTEELPEPAAQVAQRATELSGEAQAQGVEVVAATEKAALPALPLPHEAPAGPAAPAPDQPLPLHQAPVGKELLTGAWLGHLADGPGGLPADHAVAGAAGTELLRVGSPPSDLGELPGPPAFHGVDFFPGTTQRLNGPASPNSPEFPPSSTIGLGASGSGASFFVPIAALLALLALASPAILRRLREPPDFPAPTPFVCALERPG
ncbi:MAG TPA: hypothetical protein VF259_05690 [Solirubrobacterales bacterium]